MKTVFNLAGHGAAVTATVVMASESRLANQIRYIQKHRGGELIVLESEATYTWENGTGYFDGAVMVPIVPEGFKYAAARDRHGRLLLVVATAVGNVVLFERYVGDGLTVPDITTANVPSCLRAILPQGAWSRDDISYWLNPLEGITMYVDDIIKAAAKATNLTATSTQTVTWTHGE